MLSRETFHGIMRVLVHDEKFSVTIKQVEEDMLILEHS